MSEEESTSTVNVGNIHVDKVVATSPRSDNKQTLLQMTPFYSVLIAVLGLIASNAIQIWQLRSQATEVRLQTQQKVDEDWRASVDKLSDSQSALVATLEMETFLNAPAYRERAAVIMSTKLPKIPDEQQFDVELAEIAKRADIGNQAHLLPVARAITNDLREEFDSALKKHPAYKTQGKTFKDFLLNPDEFGLDGPGLETVLSETWKLDSSIRVLQEVWKKKGVSSRAESPVNVDLNGIEFYAAGNIDFRGIDFSGADLSGSEFIGDCMVDPSAKAADHCNAAPVTITKRPPPPPGMLASPSSRNTSIAPKREAR